MAIGESSGHKVGSKIPTWLNVRKQLSISSLQTLCVLNFRKCRWSWFSGDDDCSIVVCISLNSLWVKISRRSEDEEWIPRTITWNPREIGCEKIEGDGEGPKGGKKWGGGSKKGMRGRGEVWEDERGKEGERRLAKNMRVARGGGRKEVRGEER